MSTIPGEEHSLREMMSAYDVGQPGEKFRAQLHERLRVEMRGATRAACGASPGTTRRAAPLWWTGFVTAALALAVAGVAITWTDAPHRTPDQATRGTTEITADDPGLPAPWPSEVATAEIETPPTVPMALIDPPAVAPQLDPPIEAPGDDAAPPPPMRYVLHSDTLVLSPEQQRWRKAWCLLEDTDEPAEVFERWESVHRREISQGEPANYEMAYRIQSALIARPQLDQLARPLLDGEADESKFVHALASVGVENVQQMLDQLTGDMATSAKLYLELLLRSRENDDIEQLDGQLHRALASERLDDARRDLVRRWIEQLDAEKQRRRGGPIMM